MSSLDITTGYHILCIALVIAIMVMAASLVAFVTTTYESIQRIRIARKTRDR